MFDEVTFLKQNFKTESDKSDCAMSFCGSWERQAPMCSLAVGNNASTYSDSLLPEKAPHVQRQMRRDGVERRSFSTRRIRSNPIFP